MFTIKYIASNGEEFAMECGSYFVEPLPAQTSNCADMRFTTYDAPWRGAEYSGLWAGKRCDRRPDADQIHVMNRFGATVASHYFEPKMFQGGDASAQAA